VIVHHSRYIGSTTLRVPGFSPPSGEEVGEVQFELMPSQFRKVSSSEIIKAWRKKVGSIAGSLRVSYDTVGGPPFGKEFEFQLLSSDTSQLRSAATALRKTLAGFSGVFDADDDLTLGKRELRLKLTPLARSLGMTLQELALQIRYRITGQEVMRLQRGRDEVRVYVRYPRANRKSLNNLDELWIRTRQGKSIPLSKLAIWKTTRDLDVIRRISRQRMVTVSAALDSSKGSTGSIMRTLNTNTFPKIFKQNPDVRLIMSGQAREQGKVFGGMKVAFPIVIFAIFVILVAVFRSYSQAFLILSMVPFGLIGAVLGHMLMGYPLTILSFFGIVGLSGMVVNDSLVLMDKLNRLVLEGEDVYQAAWLAGQARLRAILSTTLTTFAGLAPLLFEKSLQAQFLIPMALSIGFGIVFATFITLIMVPSLYLITNDIRCFFHWLLKGRWPAYEEVEPISKLRREREELERLGLD
jgi:multidrug efflux pump subunit AcrB